MNTRAGLQLTGAPTRSFTLASVYYPAHYARGATLVWPVAGHGCAYLTLMEPRFGQDFSQVGVHAGWNDQAHVLYRGLGR
jgi:hypothetical protein